MHRNSRNSPRPTAACADRALGLACQRGGWLRSLWAGLAAAPVLLPLPLVAAQEEVVDVAALVAAANAKMTETNGWTMTDLDGYTDGTLRFNTKDDALLSPHFPSPVVRLVCRVRCSTLTPTRSLAVLDAETDRVCAVFANCEKDNKLEEQSVALDASEKVCQFKLVLDGSGNTGWGIAAMTVITADGVSRPLGLQLERATATQATFSWTNGAHCVSNRVDLYSVVATPSEETVFSCAFDNFTVAGKGQSVNYDERMLLENAPLSGVNVYAPTSFVSGVCQIGTGDKLGSLFHPGFDDCTGLTLRLVARRYPKDNEVTHVSYLDGETTNVVAALTLTDAFTTYEVDLSSVPAWKHIRIGWSGTSRHRRVWVDSLSFVRAQGEVRLSAGTGAVAAGEGPVRFSTRSLLPLRPDARWVIEVRSLTAEGVASDPAELPFGTKAASGMGWLVK